MVRPLEDDFANHQNLIKLFAQRDPDLANSQVCDSSNSYCGLLGVQVNFCVP